MKALPLNIIFWYVFPILIMFASSYVVSRLSLTEKFKIKSADIATPFLFIGLHAISMTIFKLSVLPYLIILIMVIGIVVAIGHARYYGDIQYERYFKMFWRIVFLVTLILYILLIIISFIHYV